MRIKICGITTEADAEQAARLGADAIGLNFYLKSPRFINRDKALTIIRGLPPFVDPVALFVNEPLSSVFFFTWQLAPVHTVQWHGENPEVPDNLAYRFIPAFAIRDQGNLKQVEEYLYRCRSVAKMPAAVLLDSSVAGQYGGTGHTAPWELLAGFDPGVPVILAGGLTPDNVAEAIRLVRPYAVDVASGVESSPGKKDTEKMRRFIDNAREAGG